MVIYIQKFNCKTSEAEESIRPGERWVRGNAAPGSSFVAEVRRRPNFANFL